MKPSGKHYLLFRGPDAALWSYGRVNLDRPSGPPIPGSPGKKTVRLEVVVGEPAPKGQPGMETLTVNGLRLAEFRALQRAGYPRETQKIVAILAPMRAEGGKETEE